MTHPRGLGAYFRALDDDTAERDAKRARAARLAWAALMVETPNGHIEKTARMAKHADALRAKGIAVWLWTFPSLSAVPWAHERTKAALVATGAHGVILDIEADFKGQPEACEHLVRSHLDILTEAHGLGVTSYPIAAFHRMPWAEMSAGFGSPQLYKTAAQPALIERALREYGERHGGVVVPLAAAYLGDHELLRGDLCRIVLDGEGKPRVPGAGIWSFPQLSGPERRVCAEVAELAGW